MRLLTAVSTLALLAAPALAADMYAPASTGIPPVVPATQWTGFYLGANVGGGWSDLDSSLTLAKGSNSLTLNHTNEASGIIGGGQVGYNYQTGAIVFGVEADFGLFGFSKTRDIASVTLGSTTYAVGSKINDGFNADVTGRLGYAMGPALFYVKGGWAYFDGSAGLDIPATITVPGSISQSGFDGWVLGGGIEYALSPSWSIKGEYKHYDFGSFTFTPDAVKYPKFVVSNDLSADTVVVGLNYHFGASAYTPLK